MKWHINRGTYNDQRWEELDADGRPTGRFLPAEQNFPPIIPPAASDPEPSPESPAAAHSADTPGSA